MRIIINADDLGISGEVNDAIFSLMSQGIVTSATLIANHDLAGETLSHAHSVPEVSIGVHLNLTEFRPLSPSAALGPILAPDGTFARNAIRTTTITRSLSNAVFQEWSLQIERFIALGGAPSHLNSHHHVHTIPSLFPVLKRVQRKYQIRKVRISRNFYGRDGQIGFGLETKKRLWNSALRCYYRTKTTHAFGSFFDFYRRLETGQIPRWAFSMGNATSVEVMVHPGNPLFAEETKLLSNEWIAKRELQLTSYNEL